MDISTSVVDQQPDTAATTGSTPLDSLENIGVSAAGTLAGIGLTAIAPNGRYQYDPNNQNFRSIPQWGGISGAIDTVGGGGLGSLLLIAFILWLFFR